MSEAAFRDFSFAAGKTNWKIIEAPQAPSDNTKLSGSAIGNASSAPEFKQDANDEIQVAEANFIEFRGAHTVSIVDQIISRAVDFGASDIHIDPFDDEVRIRYRVDGVLQRAGRIPVVHRDAVVSRIKIMASLDIAEKRRPQDGRIRIEIMTAPIDLRVSTLPTSYGEKVVLRILDRRTTSHRLDSIGLQEGQHASLQRALRRPHGMILVTGPTGSGKTTTLYAALRHLNTGERNILTIEDPVEYQIEGVNQAQVRPDIQFTFSAGLRAFLRQDPDVIMVGEIRDTETAHIAVRAAMTGHLMLSTLHTNDAASTVGRLLDMGIEPFLLAGSVHTIIAQRLLRRVCTSCRSLSPISAELKVELDLEIDSCFRGRGCRQCRGTGFSGRVAVFEQMEITDAISKLVVEGAPVSDIGRQAVNEGMISLRTAVNELVANGDTTPEEAVRVTM